MKPSLQLRLGQSLTMTPQLQQAIRLLQLSTLELQTEIQQALESNPMLEEEAPEDVVEEPNADAVADSSADSATESASGDGEQPAENVADQDVQLETDSIPDELPMDTQWDDVYDAPPASTMSADDANRALENRSVGGESLYDHLRWQLDMTPLSVVDQAIALVIIDAVDDEGFLGQSVDELVEALGNEEEAGQDEVGVMLKLVQSFDPVGVAARDLRETLMIQLNALDEEIPGRALAQRMVEHYFDLLGRRDFRQLKRRMKVDDDALGLALELVRTLNPRPGGALDGREAQYVTPDVYVYRYEGKWRVDLNPGSTPRLAINQQYAALIRRGDSSPDNTFLKNNLQEARWLLKSLQSRNDTLMRVSRAIVERQQGFLDKGEEAMKAMVLHDIADLLDLHESTISRVTSNKYMHTPRGVFELKYFFSSHVGTADGGEASSTAIRAVIRRLVEGEQQKKPFSDNKLATLLEQQGFRVARRTVAKYREAMAIPSSSERKRLV